MAKCERKHKACSITNAPLPTRAIDVGSADSDTLRLVETAGQTSKYVALSHCWGKCRAFLTTRANLNDRKRGFRMADLPGTFRDAVRVVRSLGIRYVWIDSVCILQGDVDDWEIESAKMAGVYENATLVIAAANAADDGEGFLKERKRQYMPTSDPYPPLHNRAWTLQERYLSIRIIFFYSLNLQWECKQAVWHELGRDNVRNNRLVQEIIPQPLENGGLSYCGWYKMVQDYTSRAITYETDKLPALSALAARVAQESKDTYLAGIWKGDLLRGLLWYREVRRRFRAQESSLPFSNTGEKPQRKVFIAPSWSWASFPGAVGY
ncbi:HET-domain-containing protein, partial [Glonium stellatum]